MARDGVYDVFIGGAGVTGTSLAYVLVHFTNVKRIRLCEYYGDVAQVNSNAINNSQTLHSGEIETNFTLEKALEVKEAARLLAAYLEKFGAGTFLKVHKMILAVGEKEVEELEERYEVFRTHFPHLKRLEREEIGRYEPFVVKGRREDEKLLALLSERGFAVDYYKLAASFLAEAKKTEKDISVSFDTEIRRIKKEDSFYVVETSRGDYAARVVVMATGPYSLLFAHSLGYGREFSILPVAGSFYRAYRKLNGKVYTMQIPKIPFAAVHGDPAVYNPDETRFGPTAKVLPLLERHHYRTLFDFLRTRMLSAAGISSLCRIIADREIASFVVKNILYDMPILGKLLFLRRVRKIIPTMTYRELHFAKRAGGIRPQVVNMRARTLEMGTAKICGDRIIFNITPSPGASVCLKNAQIDARSVVTFLGEGFFFDEEKFKNEFGYSNPERG